MTIGNALNFIKRAMADSSFRDRLNGTSTPAELKSVLLEEGLCFSADEFEDAINSRLVKCGDWESASQLKEFQGWWELLQQIAAQQAGEGGCESNKCGGGCCGNPCE
jgi:hypothetical protein